MENRHSQLRIPSLTVVFAALLLSLFALACPAAAMADEETVVVAHSGEGDQRVDYTDIQDALEAGYTGKVIVMDADWIPSEHYSKKGVTILVEKDQKITIDMAGHTIGGGGADNAGLYLSDNVECTLMSSVKKTIAYDGVVNVDGKKAPMQVTTGGLVTSDYDGISGLGLESSAKCTLDGVTVAGCISSGVHMYQDTTLVMKGGATIEHNRGESRMNTSKSGGGICVTGVDASISMSDSSIRNNYAYSGGGVFMSNSDIDLNMAGGAVIEDNSATYGGGVYIWYVDSGLTMTGGAAIQGNTAETGGGVYAHRSCTLKSPDGKGFIKGNTASGTSSDKRNGGGIYARSYGGLGSSIEGITIAGNHSAYDGGGIELAQAATTIKDCTITGNSAARDGGGVHVDNTNDMIDNCTITGNWCNDGGGSYEGGGVYVDSSYDIKLAGTCVIRYNTRGKDTGNADDVMLRENFGATAKAYITGALDQGSSVGVRTGTTGDRRIAKSFKPETKDCLFYDMNGYYVSYGTDEGGDAWQRHTTKEFTVSLDGKAYGKYRNGVGVALSVPAVKDGKVFWRWDAKYTTGLNPFSDYFPGNGAFSNAVAFTMPQNDVNLVPLYIDKVTVARFVVEAPEAGRALATTGKLWRTDGGANASVSVPCSVYWYEVDKDGNVSDASAVGVAKANTRYKAYVTAPEAGDQGFFYDDAISVAVSLVSASGDLVAEPKVTDSYLTLSNSVAAKTDAYKTGAGSGVVKTGTVEVQLKNKGLVGNGKGEANAVALMADGDAQADLGDSAQITYAYSEDTDTVTLTAPAREGYNFCNWDGVPSDVAEADDEAGTVTAAASKLENIKSLTAVYTPVATALEVSLSAPVADDPLAATCADIEATCSDGETVSLKTGFKVDSFEVAWSPEGKDGKAGYSTAYTALIKLCDGEGFEDVEKALAAAAKVTCNGTEAASAGFAVKDGELCLAITFPATATAQATGITQPADVELTFEQAKACSELGIWPLPEAVGIETESGVAAEGDIEWEAVEGFDANATGAQELTVKGKVTHITTADGNEVKTDNVSLDVICKIKVAAPAQGGDDPASGANANGDKSALAKTSDAIPVLAVAAVAVIAVAAIAVAIVAARRRKG